MDTANILISLLRAEICGGSGDEIAKEPLSEEMRKSLYAFSKRQELTHIAGQALSRLGLLEDDDVSGKFKQQAVKAAYRHVQMDRAYAQICRTLDEGQIPYIPLKGAVLRAYYPEPWMRNSCDIDILVRQEMLDSAIAALKEKAGYTGGEKYTHDASMFSPDGIHLELHFDTIEVRAGDRSRRAVLSRVWEDASPEAPGAYHYCMSDEMFYFYHMAHTAKHIETGGCGIRPILDTWILNHRMPHDRQKRQALLSEGGLLKFANAAEKLAEVWFSGAEPDVMDRQYGDYILRAGIYGSNANRAALGQAIMGGKFRYLILRRVFMPRYIMEAEYPVLVRHKWLLPVYQVYRWLQMIAMGRIGKTLREAKANVAATEDARSCARELAEHLGL